MYIEYESCNIFWVELCLCLRVIIFGSIQFLLKKITKPNFFFLKKAGSNWFGSVLAQFFPVWLGFFLVWLVFSGFSSVWVRFGFFGFRLIKPKLNRTGWFFQNFNRFFFHSSVFSFIYFCFLGLIGFLIYLLTLEMLIDYYFFFSPFLFLFNP